MAAQDEGQGLRHEGHVDQAAPDQRARPVLLEHSELVEILQDVLDRVKDGDSLEGNITWALPEDLAEECRGKFDVIAVYRISNTMGQGGMRMICTEPGQEPASPRCTAFCRDGQKSRGHKVTTSEELSAMRRIALATQGIDSRALVTVLYQAGFGYNQAADYIGREHEWAYKVITGQA